MKTEMGIDVDRFLQGMKPHALSFFRENIIGLREELSSGHAKRCHLCDNVGISIDSENIILKGDLHLMQCEDCSGEFVLLKYSLQATVEHTARRSQRQPIIAGHEDCHIQLFHGPNNQTNQGSIEYIAPELTELSERIEKHHVSYEPEVTVPLCSSCHGKVHSDDHYAPFQPDMKRIEWQGR